MVARPSKGNSTNVAPTRAGKDLDNFDETKDAHIRIETYNHNGTNVYIDIFDSSIDDASPGYLTSEMFPYTKEGADEATKFLQDNGFQANVAVR